MKVSVEVIEVEQEIFDFCGVKMISNVESINNHRDVVLEGKKRDLLQFLELFMDEDEEYLIANKVDAMYSIDCEFYKNEFETIGLLVEHIKTSGMDPNYEIMKNGVGIGEQVIDFITP